MQNTDNTELIQGILAQMEKSSMEDDEKTMWRVLLPSLEKAELEKLKNLLDKEVQVMTDIYTKSLKK